MIKNAGLTLNYTQPSTNDVNCSVANVETTTLYSTFDVSALGVTSSVPKIFKVIDVNPCIYGNGSSIYTIPLYTVIINVADGQVASITWDDGCFFCASNGGDCIPNALDVNTSSPITDSEEFRGCRQPSDYCYPASTVTTNASIDTNVTETLPQSPCDLKVFVVWTGTDKNGQYMTSAGKRFSRFRQYATASAYQSGLNLLSQAQDIATSAINAAETIPGRVTPNRQLGEVGGEVGMGVDAAAADPVVYTAPVQVMPLPW